MHSSRIASMPAGPEALRANAAAGIRPPPGHGFGFIDRRAFGVDIARVTTSAIMLVTLSVLCGPDRVSAQGPEPGLAPTAVLDGQPPTEPVVRPLPVATKNLLQVIRDGGLMMLPIAVCSFLLLVFVFERAVSLRTGRVVPGPFVRRFLEQLRENQLGRDAALELCQRNRSPVSQVFAAAVKKWGRPSVEVEQALLDAGERVTTDLRKYLRLFNGIATISPMLGLLGTVTGMISSFNSIAASEGMGRPELLAEGIGEALLSTAAGLCVAIPALVAYWFFVGRVNQLTVHIDSISQEVVELIASDSWLRDQADDAGRNKRRLKVA